MTSTENEAMILAVLKKNGPLTSREIADAVGRDIQKVTRNLRSMERYGFIDHMLCLRADAMRSVKVWFVVKKEE